MIEGDAVSLIVGDESQGVCSKTAPLAEPLEQDLKNRVFLIASIDTVDAVVLYFQSTNQSSKLLVAGPIPASRSMSSTSL